MSIEPTSVSNPVVRENEISSKRSAWSEMQGSATGSKDGQLSSFWDKAFIGAQKLFGIETTARNDLRENENSARENEERKRLAETRYDNRRLNVTPGFGNSGFRRLAPSIQHEDPPGPVSIAPTDKSLEERRELSSLEDRWLDQDAQESRVEQDALEDRNEELDDESDSKKHRAKTADPLFVVPTGSAKIESKGISAIKQDVDNQELEQQKDLIGTNPAMSELDMSFSLAKSSSEETAPKVPSPLKAIEEVSLGSVRRVPSEDLESGESNSDSPQGLKGTRRGEGQNAVVEAKSAADLKAVALSKHSNTSKDSNSKDAESLVIDADKAKQNLTAMFDRAKSSNSSKSGQILSSVSVQNPQSASVANSHENPVEQEGGLDGSSKNTDTVRGETAKSHVRSSVRQDAVKPVLNALNSVGRTNSDLSHSKPGEIRLAGSVSSATESYSVSGKLGISSQSLPVGSPAASAGSTTSNSGSVLQDQLKSPVEKTLGKQEFEAVLKGTVTAKPAGATSRNDSTQGIQLAGSDASGSSKSSFAAKAQPVSYTSKTVDETKEVYTALSKSVDRLVNSKSDTVSIRINFDQGGSMALRVSMDSGHISTAMQTDLPGLESLIKSSWSEFANELNQKGVKLNAPQFTNLENENTKNDSFMNLDQKGGQSKGEPSSDTGANGSRPSSHSNRQQAEATSLDSNEVSSDGDLNTEQELKTYA